ncbi:MAG: c-type cytochrome [Caulobacteraceae bacterium]
MLKGFIAGVVAVCLAMGAGALFVVETGSYDVRASTPHFRPVAWGAHTTMIHASERGAATVTAPGHFTVPEIRAGFALYDKDCVTCHGGPGIDRAAWVSGMNPSPPWLIDTPRSFSAAQLYWIVDNGVKMTGMPSWAAVHNEGQIWDIVAFLEAQPYLTRTQYLRMRAMAGARTSSRAGR